MYKVFSDA